MLPFRKEGKKLKNYLTYKAAVKTLAPLYEKYPQVQLFRVEGDDKFEKQEFIALIIAVVCSPTCKVNKNESFLYSQSFHIFLQKEGILEGVCDDVISWMRRGVYITKEDAQIIVDNTCEYLSKQK